MPLYEYKCEAGHHFERIVKFSDPPVETCPECGAKVEKLLSSPAIQFKGSGWYITDYAKKSSDGASGKSSQKSTDATKSDSKPDSSKSESTPAASPATGTTD